jgi:GNAT superfamily N-acetyltransferase
MAKENVEIVRSIYRGWDRGDYGSDSWAGPELEWTFVDWFMLGSGKGIASLSRTWSDFLKTWEEFHNEAVDYRHVDGDRVLVLTRFWGRGRGSGLEIGESGSNGASLFQMQEEKVIRAAFYWSRDRALADLGLAE